ncbi:MAG: sigma-70 family RNA polymerase sigma factor [Chryseolinea sp.]
MFRTEFSKISSVLAKRFGLEHIDVAEDISSETFLLALNTWPYQGVPENPQAWLYTVAKNKAKNYLIRDQLFKNKISKAVRASISEADESHIDLSDQNISDSLLQMLFVVCHPAIPAASQVALALRILCGFGIDEIANAFVTNKETINKRLVRAKEKLRNEKVKIEIPSVADINSRLESVLRTLYLLFNEGYYSESKDTILQKDLCLEAMRLTQLLIENEKINSPPVMALYALMCFHSSRFPARVDRQGQTVLYDDQNQELWDFELITRGAYYMNVASKGDHLSRYHLEAGIAYWHTVKESTKEKWESILQLYNQLLQIDYSPIAALNRTFALAKTNGKEEAIQEAEKLKLTDNHYYFTLLGELYREIDPEKSNANFELALSLAKSDAERTLLKMKLDGGLK